MEKNWSYIAKASRMLVRIKAVWTDYVLLYNLLDGQEFQISKIDLEIKYVNISSITSNELANLYAGLHKVETAISKCKHKGRIWSHYIKQKKNIKRSLAEKLEGIL